MKKSREVAYKFLSYRLRSKKEMEDRLRKEGCEGSIINEIVCDLERWGYLNDEGVAWQWAFSWATNKGWGKETRPFIFHTCE